MISHLVNARIVRSMAFSASSGAQALDLSLQLQTFKKGDLSIEDYILFLNVIIDHLDTVRHPMPDHDLLYYALGGLDANWNSFISRITLRFNLINFDELF